MMNVETSLREKGEALCAMIAGLGDALVAFSGGADSTLLAAAAQRVLGGSAAAVTVRSPLSTRLDRADAERMAREIGIRHFYLDLNELTDPDFAANDPRKCYYCKKLRLSMVVAFANANGYGHVLDGSNADDLDDYRPGMEAMREYDAVSSPLLACGFSKADVRALSRAWKLATWSKPAAACLASRVAPPLPIERKTLESIDEAENFLLGILPPDSQLRVRHHGEIARIEADPVALKVLMARSREVVTVLRTIGYRYVTLDLGGYATGSLNPDERLMTHMMEGSV